MTPEGKVKAALKTELSKLFAWQYWPVSNGMGVHGIPDCIACIRGRFVSFEVKAPGRRGEKNRGCSGLQVIQGNAIQETGGLWFVVDSHEEIIEALNKLKTLI